jgi:hypothetical protein
MYMCMYMKVRTLVVLTVLFTGLCALSQDSASNASALATSTAAVVPHLVQFSGIARDVNGKPLIGTVGITFLLYSDEQGGAPLWMETQNAQADAKGHYSVQLGATKPDGVPTDEFISGEARWLGVQIAGQEEQPRVLLLSVPYALKAADAATIGGLPPSAFVRANPEGGATSGSNESSSSGNSSAGTNTLDSSHTNGVSPLANKTVVTPGGKTDFLPLWTSSNVLGNSAFFQSKSGQMGLNTTTPGAALDVSARNQVGLFVDGPFSGVGAGLQLHTTGTGGQGWELLATGKTSAQGARKLNIRDLANDNDVFTILDQGTAGDFIGLYNTNPVAGLDLRWNSSFGDAMLAEIETSNSSAGAMTGITKGNIVGASGVEGAATDSGQGVTFGVTGENANTGQFGAGVYGWSTATTGPTRGIVGEADSPNGTAVWGFAVAPSETGSIIGCCAVGVWGDTSSSAPGAAGLVGSADEGQGLVAFNNSTAQLTAHITNFENSTHNVPVLKIDGSFGSCSFDTDGKPQCTQPFVASAAVDNGQRQVALYSMASPQSWHEDFGSGQLVSGRITVALEPTFAQTVNTGTEYHVFLTPEGDCRGLYVSSKTPNGFEVRELGGGNSSVAFSYRIVALRRGYETVRLEDQTARIAKLKAARVPKPSATPRARWIHPPLPKLATPSASQSNAAPITPAKLAAAESGN